MLHIELKQRLKLLSSRNVNIMKLQLACGVSFRGGKSSRNHLLYWRKHKHTNDLQCGGKPRHCGPLQDSNAGRRIVSSSSSFHWLDVDHPSSHLFIHPFIPSIYAFICSLSNHPPIYTSIHRSSISLSVHQYSIHSLIIHHLIILPSVFPFFLPSIHRLAT